MRANEFPKDVLSERQVESVTSNTCDDSRGFLIEAARIPSHTYAILAAKPVSASRFDPGCSRGTA
jgi:hypothetical protein